MAKVIHSNPNVDTPEKREASLRRFVIQSSAIEGIVVTEEQLRASNPSEIFAEPAEKMKKAK